MADRGDAPEPVRPPERGRQVPENGERAPIGDDLDRAFQRLLDEESRGGVQILRPHDRPADPADIQGINVPDYLANTPPAIVAVPAAGVPNLAGRRAIFSMAKGGDVWRSDIRIISGPHTSDAYDGRPWAWATDEGSWYRLNGRRPEEESGLHCIPLARLWVEEFMALPPAPLVVDLSAADEEDLDRLPKRSLTRATWPKPPGMEMWPSPRVPTRAPHADSLSGRRAIVATPGGYHRDLRAVSEPFFVPVSGDLVVALMHERDWYLRWDRVLDAYPIQCVWLE